MFTSENKTMNCNLSIDRSNIDRESNSVINYRSEIKDESEITDNINSAANEETVNSYLYEQSSSEKGNSKINKIRNFRDRRIDDTVTAGEYSIGYDLRIALIYMMISIVLAIGGAVYEHFSFGVYSNFMIYAFSVPLLGGTLPYMISAIHNLKSADDTASVDTAVRAKKDQGKLIEKVIKHWMYHAAIATLTAGSIIQGILAICGRPNSLVIVYPITAAVLLTITVCLKGKSDPSEHTVRHT